ncbi:MAG: hypothetical protein J5586_05120 [Clostridia bacterium]|nr:hypothetical protein [Clostridia bacterium]
MTLPTALILSLALTEALELPLLYLLGFRGRQLTIALLANVLTNPPVVFLRFIASGVLRVPDWAALLVLETAAVLVEAVVYKKAAGRPRALLDSLAANALSFSAGLAISAFIH